MSSPPTNPTDPTFAVSPDSSYSSLPPPTPLSPNHRVSHLDLGYTSWLVSLFSFLPCCLVAKLCLTLCNPMDYIACQASCPSLSPRVCSNSCPLSQWCHPTVSSSVAPFPPALNLFQHQGLFQWEGSSHQATKVLELQLQHQSFQWIFGVDFPQDWLVWSPCSPRDSQESSPILQFQSINSLVLSLLYGPTLISIHDYWKKT